MGGSGLSDTKSEQVRGKGKCCKGAGGVQVAVSGAATQMQKYVMSPSCCLSRFAPLSLSLSHFLCRTVSIADCFNRQAGCATTTTTWANNNN